MTELPAQWMVPLDVTGIESTVLEGGSVKLHLSSRSPGLPREPARIITMAWGDRYIADLLAVTIPAVLAPGNIPTFAEAFDCQFVIVTETRLFERIATSPVIHQLLRHCDLRLVPIDDLLSPWYGITLTYALVRGFVDLGEAMTETHLVFLNADFIVADGSYRKLVEVIRRGERLAVSPSYCMVQEQTIEKLLDHYDEHLCTLAISRRKMAAMIIENRHNTIRAKTVNQRLFRIHRYDQFYWHVNDWTLLGRQMPIAVVYMRPERPVVEMQTFWDYGVISEYCPTAVPCVLGDSDDFLMGELRTATTFRELLHLGWPSLDEIAADLSSFTTKDHRDYGRYTLVLHSGDLPAGIEAEKEKLQHFVDDVYRRMTPPIGHFDHPFWAKDFPRFRAMIAEGGRKMRADFAAWRAVADTPEAAKRIKRMLAEMGEIHARRSEIATERSVREQRLKAERDDLEKKYLSAKEALDRDLDLARNEDIPLLQALESMYAALEEERAAFFARGRRIVGEAFEETEGRDSAPRRDNPKRQDRRTQRAQLISRCIAPLGGVYGRFFGRLPRTTQWHPYHTMLEPAFRAVMSTEARVSKVLIVNSGGPLGPLLLRPSAASKVTVAPDMLQMGVYQEMLTGGGSFDLCLCDVSFDDLMRLRPLLENIRRHMAPDGRIIVFHHNMDGRNLDHSVYELSSRSFPLFGRSRVIFAGSLFTSLAARWFYRALYRHSIFRLGGLIAFAAVFAVCAPLARIGAWLEKGRDPQKLPRHCSSMIIEIDLVP